MQHAAAVRVRQSGRHGYRDAQRLGDRYRAFTQALGKRPPLEHRHHEKRGAVHFADVIESANIWMIELAYDPGFA